MPQVTKPIVLDETAKDFAELFGNKIDGLILAVAGVGANTGSHAAYSSYEQLQQLIREGLGAKIFPVGTQVKTERETNLTISIGDSTGITGATVDEELFLAAVGETHSGIYEAHFDGSVWHKEDEANINLETYGITVTGTPVEGDHLVITETAATLLWDILDHNKHTFQNPSLTKGVVIGMHNLFNYGVLPFYPSQLTYYAQNGLPAGKYKFTLQNGAYGGETGQDGTYVFTLTQAIPSDGGWRHSAVGAYQSSYNKSQITGGTIKTYGANPQRPEVETGITVTEYNAETDSDATDLGTFSARGHSALTSSNNVTERSAYGSNRWRDSLERLWLNSTAKAVKGGDQTFSYWYVARTNFDLPPSESVRKMAGFLYGFDSGLLNLIQPVAIKTALNDTDKTTNGEYDTTYDRIWLQSMTELGLGQNNSVSEGSTFKYWENNNTQADRIKYEGTTARYWCLRSPYPAYAGSMRGITPSGALGGDGAGYDHGVVPACVLG